MQFIAVTAKPAAEPAA